MLCWPIVTCKYGIQGQKAPQQGYENWNQTHFLLDKNVKKSIGSVLVKYDKSITYHHISLKTRFCAPFCRHGQIITFIKSRVEICLLNEGFCIIAIISNYYKKLL